MNENIKVKHTIDEVFKIMPEKKGLCSKYVYQLAKNFITDETPTKSGGYGACGTDLYYNSLKELGYNEICNKIITKSELINSIKNNDFPIGTVIAYQAIDTPKQNISAFNYGHTQFYQGDNKWVSSIKNNYNSEFVYNYVKSEKWNYRIFYPPKM